MKEHYFENEYHEIWLEGGIIYDVFKSPINVITIDIIKQMVKDRFEAIKDNYSHPILYWFPGITAINKEARQYWANSDNWKNLNAAAILVKFISCAFTYRLFIINEKPVIPTEIFTEKEEALKWMDNFAK